MPEYPPEALAAATAALVRYWNGDKLEADEYEGSARAALDAAAPLLADAVSQAILEHMKAHGPKPGTRLGGRDADQHARYTWRRHMGTAARIASKAFSTDEELKHQVAQALATGNYVACEIPEPGE